MSLNEFSQVPVIDIGPLVNYTAEHAKVAEEIATACRDSGFFYIARPAVDESLCRQL